MSIKALVQVVETHVKEEEFQIDSLPVDWDDMSELDQWRYLGEYGVFTDSDIIFTDLDHVAEVNTEEVSA